MTPLLSVCDVGVRFGGLVALAGVSLAVEEGSVTGVIGPNGAGKTTLFNVIAGLQRPTTGSVRFAGKDITHLSPHRRARLGMSRTFQRLEVFGTLSVRDNVAVAAEAPPRSGTSVDVDALLRRVGLTAAATIEADRLPTGTQRLVELARALACRPRLLLLDEAASGVGPTELETMADLLRGLAGEGLTVLLVEHDIDFVTTVCDRVVMLDHGAIRADGTPKAVSADPVVRAAYLGVGG